MLIKKELFNLICCDICGSENWTKAVIRVEARVTHLDTDKVISEKLDLCTAHAGVSHSALLTNVMVLEKKIQKL